MTPTLTCDRCLRTDHVRCRILDCACSCRNHSFMAVSDQAPKRRRELRPRAVARPRPKARIMVTRSIRLSDIPAEVRERTGKHMRDDQLGWARRLQADGWPLREIGATLGGFAAPSLCQTLAGRKRPRVKA